MEKFAAKEPPSRQTGVALIAILAILLSGALYFFVRQLNAGAPQLARDEATALALAQAKDALIGFAMAYPEQHKRGSPERIPFVPGHLPCPDSNGTIGVEGNEDPNCSAKGVTVVGYLPWKTLGLPPLRDGWGNCLWYAVSGSFKANPKADLLNWDSLGQFQVLRVDKVGADPPVTTWVAGQTPKTKPVAVVFSPGPPIPGQDRTGGSGECGGDYDSTHFLETVGSFSNSTPNPAAELDTAVVTQGIGGTHNDRLLWISRDELLSRGIERRSDLSAKLTTLQTLTAECLAHYGASNSGRLLPWAAKLQLSGTNPYENDSFKDQSGLLAGRLPFLIRQSFQKTGSTLPSFATCSGVNPEDCRLFRTDNCPLTFLEIAGYETTFDDPTKKDSPDGWLEKWKDHLFFAVAEDFEPDSMIPAASRCSDPTTPGRKCLYVDGVGPFAAVVAFAGPELPGKNRTDLAHRNLPDNYLEGTNATAIDTPDPDTAAFGQFSTTGGNDKFVCIKKDLTISPDCAIP